MALTVTTDLTTITDAETTTGWTGIQSSGSSAVQLEPDFFAQNLNCISRAVTGSGAWKGAMFDNGAAIDFTTGTHQDKLVYIWLRTNVPTLNQTRTNAGIVVRLATGSATTNYREWYVDGSDTLRINDGWICYVIDPQSAGNNTSGTYNANSVRYFGGRATTTATAKGQNFGIDAIRYGRGELRVTGTVTTAGEGFKEIADADFGTAANRYGIITVKSGIFYVRGKIVLGHATSNTTFSSRGETVVFETPSYKEVTNVVKAIPDTGVGSVAGHDGSTSYLGLGIIGGSGTTTIDLGVLVGTDSGRSGSNLSVERNAALTTPSRTRATITVSTSATIALSVYGSSFTGFEGALGLYGTGLLGDDAFNNIFSECGNISSNLELDNSFVLNSIVTANTSALIWDPAGATNPDGYLDNTTFIKGTTDHHAIEFPTGAATSITLTGISFSGFNASQDVNASIFHIRRTTGTVTINLIGCSSDVAFTNSYRTDGAIVVIVIDPVVLSVTVKDLDTGLAIEDARVIVPVADGTNFAFEASVTITSTGTTATVTHNTHGLATNDNILIEGADQDEYNGVYTITVTTANEYTYTMNGDPVDTATGTITATMVLINARTPSTGIVTDSRTYSGNQTVSGWARRATFGPSYTTATWTDGTNTLTKTGAFTGMSGTFLITITAGTNMTSGVYLATWVNANDVTLPGGAGSADSSNVEFTIGAQPRYRQAPVSDTIDSVNGLSVTVFLQPDE